MDEHVRMMRPRKRYDREYATEWQKERDWLAERGFEPVYVKHITDKDGLPTGVDRYKYRKSSALFENLAVFYQMQEAERGWRRAQRAIENRGEMIAEGHGDPDGDSLDFKAALDEAIRAYDQIMAEDDTL